MKAIILRAAPRNFFLFVLMLLLFAGVFCFDFSYAQQDPGIATGVQVSPVRFDWDMNAGEERTGVINLKNYSEKTFDVEVQIEDFYVSDDTTEARFFVPQENHPLFAYDVINWIEMDKNTALAPKEGKDVYFHIKVPSETPTGGYYGAIFFKVTARNNEEGADSQSSKIIIQQRIGVLLVMAVKGKQPIIRSGELRNLKPAKKIFWDKPVEITAEAVNDGNLHYKASGSIGIFKFGKKVGSIKIDPKMIYPGRFRTYDEKWDFLPWAYGFYRAHFNLQSEDGEIRMNGDTFFWVIPWKTTLAIIILIIVIILVYKWFGSKFEIKRKDESSTED